MKRIKPILTTGLLFLFLCGISGLQAADYKTKKSYKEWPREASKFAEAFYRTDEARRIGENVLLYQLESGGWPKNIYIPEELTPDERKKAETGKSDVRRGTIDNRATTTEIDYLAKLYNATGDSRYRDAAIHGIDYLLEAQYDNGGWPQFYPEATGYHAQITFNDNAMVNVLQLLRDVARQKTPYTFLPDSTATAARRAFQKGIGCILTCQVKQNGQPTVWCAQHDRKTLAPCKARAYELPSLSGAESVNITLLLMSLPQPDSTVVQAVEGAVAWFRKTAITNLKREDFTNAQGEKDYRMVKTANAPRIWARFYEVETNRPFFCGRDGVKKYRVEDIEYERRNGYSWYNRAPEKVLEQYDQWKKRNMRYKKHPGRKT